MRSPVYRKLLLAALLLISLTLFAVDYSVKRYAYRQQAAALQSRLAFEAGLLRDELERVPESDWTIWVGNSAQRSHSRVTITDPGGGVLADSERDSAPLAENAFQVSTPIARAGQRALVLRVAAPLGEEDSATTELRRRLLVILLGSAALALAIAYLVSRSLSGRVTRLKQFAETLVESRASTNPRDASTDELGVLEQTVARVAEEIGKLLDRLRFESARREAILSSMAEGVLAVDRELRVTFCNEAFLRAVGARRPVSEQTRLLELVRDPGLLDVLGHVVNTGEPRKLLLKIPAASTRSFEVQAAPLMVPSGQGAIAILYDTTDIERLEQVRKDFVANVSHEFRTPLAGIIGYADTLLDGALDDAKNRRPFLEIIRSNAIQLNNIASDLLVLSELESAVDPAEPERVSVREVLDAVLLTVQSEATAREVRLVRENIEDVHVMGSRLRLEQAVLNLMANAIKFNRTGGEVRVRAVPTSDGQVLIAISDTGVGIPSQDLPRIFERFYRVDKGRSRQVGGTGLGLSIVKHVVERMKGTVSVESQLGKGSSFTMLLPAVSGPNSI